MDGWISIYRTIKEHWIWDDPIKFQWWIDILLTVNHKARKINVGNTLIECKKGQTIKSLTNWANQWNCTRDTARNFLELLKSDGMIKTENLKKTTRLTVCKYDNYQNILHTIQTQSKRNPNAIQTIADTNNNDNKENKENNIDNRAKKFGESLECFITPENKKEIANFWRYWTEPNKSKTKLRFELEKTWDNKRRLETWFKNSEKYNK